MMHHIPAKSSKVEWFRRHLRDQCPYVSEAVRTEAAADYARSKQKSAQSTIARLQCETSYQENIPLATTAPPGHATLYSHPVIPTPEPSANLSAQSSIASTGSYVASTLPYGMEESAPEVDWDRWIGTAEASGGTC